MITGPEKPDSGEDRHRPDRASSRYVDQSRDSLPDDEDGVARKFPAAPTSSRSASSKCRRAPISAASTSRAGDQQKIVGQLSGGERGRLHLAKTLLEGGNVLLLDEPSNDLDVETLRALEDALLEFPGCALVISHDRWFLDRIATHILAFEGDSQGVFFPGNYQEYEEDKRKRLGEEAAKPKRLRYKPITR